MGASYNIRSVYFIGRPSSNKPEKDYTVELLIGSSADCLTNPAVYTVTTQTAWRGYLGWQTVGPDATGPVGVDGRYVCVH